MHWLNKFTAFFRRITARQPAEGDASQSLTALALCVWGFGILSLLCMGFGVTSATTFRSVFGVPHTEAVLFAVFAGWLLVLPLHICVHWYGKRTKKAFPINGHGARSLRAFLWVLLFAAPTGGHVFLTGRVFDHFEIVANGLEAKPEKTFAKSVLLEFPFTTPNGTTGMCSWVNAANPEVRNATSQRVTVDARRQVFPLWPTFLAALAFGLAVSTIVSLLRHAPGVRPVWWIRVFRWGIAIFGVFLLWLFLLAGWQSREDLFSLSTAMATALKFTVSTTLLGLVGHATFLYVRAARVPNIRHGDQGLRHYGELQNRFRMRSRVWQVTSWFSLLGIVLLCYGGYRGFLWVDDVDLLGRGLFLEQIREERDLILKIDTSLASPSISQERGKELLGIKERVTARVEELGNR